MTYTMKLAKAFTSEIKLNRLFYKDEIWVHTVVATKEQLCQQHSQAYLALTWTG